MTTVNQLLNIALVVLTIVSAGGLGLVRSKSRQQKADFADTLTKLRADLSDADARDMRRVREMADQKVEMADLSAQIERMRTNLDFAMKQATGEKHWRDLGQSLTDHHSQAMQKMDALAREIGVAFRKIEERLDVMAREMDK